MHVPGAMAVAATVHLFADAAGTIDLSNVTELRGRSTQDVSPNPSLDVADTASVGLGYGDARWRLSLDYSAMVLEANAQLLPAPTVFQSGDLGVTWRGRNVTLGAAQYGSYGQVNSGTNGVLPASTSGPTPPPPSVQLLAAPATVEFVASRSVLTAADRLDPTQSLSLTVEYDLQGGLGTSEATLPLVQGPRALAVFDQAVSPRDTIEVRLSVVRSDASASPCSAVIPRDLLQQPTQPCAPQGQIGQATGAWQYRLSPNSTVSGGAGVALAEVRFQDDQPHFDSAVLPVATASMQYVTSSEDRSADAARIDVAAAPFVDLLTGDIDERAQVTGTLSLTMQTVRYTGTLGATRSIDSPFIEPMSSVQVVFETDYLASPAVQLGGGVRYFWQDQVGFGAFSMAMLFADLKLNAPKLRF